MFTPRDYQVYYSTLAAEIIKEHMIVYLAWEERTGKSLTGVLTMEQINVKRILVITKKNALKDWVELVTEKYPVTKQFKVTTYGKACHENPKNYDAIILDEAHNYISAYPKPSATWKKVARLTKGKPILYMSATPHAQGYQMLYHQFALSTWSPWWKYSTFYNWFRRYGIQYTKKVHDREVNQYDRTKVKLIKTCIDHLFISKTRKELDFPHEPIDKIHWIELDDNVKEDYNTLVTKKVLNTGPTKVVADTVMKLRTNLHMLEGGTVKATLFEHPSEHPTLVAVKTEKLEDVALYHAYYLLANDEKIRYIKEHWGDTSDVVIMYNFIGEGHKLRAAFKNATVVQATSFAEGVDFTHKKHLVIYSQDYSTARHTQRRARQAGFSRDSVIHVHFLLVKNAVSHQVYKTVALNKKNYVDSRFEKETL